MADRKKMTNSGTWLMCSAIIRKALEDYAMAYMGHKVDSRHPDGVMREIERWFRVGGYTDIPISLDAEYLLKKAKLDALEETIKAYREYLDPERTSGLKICVNREKGKESVYQDVPPRLEKPFRRLMEKQYYQLIEEYERIKNGEEV